MRTLYFQPFSGASGDMILGALIDVGLPLGELQAGLSTLHLHGWRLESQKELRGPFQTTRLKVLLEAGEGHPAEGHHAHSHSHSHAHRGLEDILGLIHASSLPEAVKDASGAVFRRLGEAEARVHGIPVESVHFHEVGAVDSIVDIVGSCLGLHILGIEEVWSGPVSVGTGFVRGAHGKMPLPAPATLELLRGFPVRQEDSGAELTTPTGAALLTTLAKEFGTMPPLEVLEVGYGAGNDREGPVPNALRVVLGERSGSADATDKVVVLETNIDDMSSQWIGHLLGRLFEAGALDVGVTPLLMKKSRPAHEVKIMVSSEAEGKVLATLFRESTTFGVRRREAERITLQREMESVETPWGTVSLKVGRLGTEVVTISPEYEDLRAASERAGLPLKDMHRKVLELYGQRP